MNIRLRRPSPALVIACIALFASMGGVSYAFSSGSIDGREIKNGAVTNADIRNGTITTKDLRNNDVRGADIRNSTIGGRDVALDTLGANDIKESTLGKVPTAGQADSAANAGNANTVGGVPVSGFVRSEAPAFTALGLSGGATVSSGEAAPAFDVDGNGYVHLAGTFTSAGGRAFTLPAGARPAATSRFAVRLAGGTNVLTVTPSGAASVPAGEVSVDGVTFAAGG